MNSTTEEIDRVALLSAIPAAVFVSDSNGTMLYANEQVYKLRNVGYTLEAEASSLTREVMNAQSKTLKRELVLECRDGSQKSVLASSAPWSERDGVHCAIHILQDITEAKARERELNRSNDELLQFARTVAHDLRVPLHGVHALAQSLIGRCDGLTENSSHIATLIEQSAVQMERLIKSLLNLAQIGHGEIQRQSLAVQAIVDNVCASLGTLIADTGTSIVCHSLPVVEADDVQLQELFQNLITNAIVHRKKSTPPVIEIRGREMARGWQFSVKDNGPGILPAHHEAIFAPLKRFGGHQAAGTGLGLTISSAIVARHGGRIWVESTGDGHGAAFCFTLSRNAVQPRKTKADFTENGASRFQPSAIGVAVLTEDARFVQVNKAFCSITGYPAAELLALDWFAVSDPNERIRIQEQIARLLDGTTENSLLEQWYFRKNAEWIRVETTFSLTNSTDNGPVNVIATCQEMTKRSQPGQA